MHPIPQPTNNIILQSSSLQSELQKFFLLPKGKSNITKQPQLGFKQSLPPSLPLKNNKGVNFFISKHYKFQIKQNQQI